MADNLRGPLVQSFLRRDPAVQRFPNLLADRPGHCRFSRVKSRTVTPAQVPHLHVTVEDGLYERPVTRSVPRGLARECRPIPARYLFGLDLERQLALVSGNGGGKLRRVAPQQRGPRLPERVIPLALGLWSSPFRQERKHFYASVSGYLDAPSLPIYNSFGSSQTLRDSITPRDCG